MLIPAPVRINIVFTSIDVKLAGGDFRTKRRNTISTPYNQLQSYNKFFNYTNMKKQEKSLILHRPFPKVVEQMRMLVLIEQHIFLMQEVVELV